MIIYLSDYDLKHWASALQELGVFPIELLPPEFLSDNWIKKMLEIIETVKLPHYKESIHHKAAHLFYKIIRNHLLFDGNKRSAVITIYCFYAINSYVLLPKAMEVYDLAHIVVKKSSKESENDIAELEQIFGKVARSFIELKSSN